MTLNNNQPIIIQATEEKQFPHLWLKNIHINSNSPSEGTIIIDCVPYNAITKEVGSGSVKTIVVRDLWSAVNNIPEVATAMQAIIAAIEPTEAWNKSKI